ILDGSGPLLVPCWACRRNKLRLLRPGGRMTLESPRAERTARPFQSATAALSPEMLHATKARRAYLKRLTTAAACFRSSRKSLAIRRATRRNFRPAHRLTNLSDRPRGRTRTQSRGENCFLGAA